MKIKIHLLFAFSIIIFSSCNDKVGDEVDKIGISFTPILHSGNDTRLNFYCNGGSFDCANVSIGYNADHTSREIILRFGDSYIADGQPCNTAHNYGGDPAEVALTLDLEPGDYSFELINKGTLLRSALHIDDQKIMLVNGSGNYIFFPQNEITYMQTPKDAIWGYTQSTDAEFQQFRDSLVSRGCTDYLPSLEDGVYARFRISDGDYYANSGSKATEFLMKSPLDTAALHSIMGYFCSNNIIETIHLTDGKGNEIIQY